MSFFEKLTPIRNRSKSDKSFKLEKVAHNFGGDQKNKPLALHEKLVKVKTNDSISQHEMCETIEYTNDIFEQLRLSILHSLNLLFQKK